MKKLLSLVLVVAVALAVFAFLPEAFACCPPKTITVTVHYSTSTKWIVFGCKTPLPHGRIHFEGVSRYWTETLTYYCVKPLAMKIKVGTFYNIIVDLWGKSNFTAPMNETKQSIETQIIRQPPHAKVRICGQPYVKPKPFYLPFDITVNHRLQMTVTGLASIQVFLFP